VAYLLKARTVEPEKQPLLANGSEATFVSRQGSKINRFPLQQATCNNEETCINSDEVMNVLTEWKVRYIDNSYYIVIYEFM
jgi:hypothetical protein